MLIAQALVVALCTWFAATAAPMWLRWSVYFGAPLVAGLVNGLLFGDLAYGLEVGSTVMMAYIGMVAIGGSLPSDYALAGYLGVAMTMLAGADPSVGLTIAVPLGLLGLLSFNVKMSLNSIWVQKADRYAAQGNSRGVVAMNLFASQIFPFITYFIPSFLCVYFGAGMLESLMAAIPSQVTSVLALAGHLIPALGLAMLMSVLFNAALLPFFIIGFVLSAYLGLGTMPIAILGAVAGILHLAYSSQGSGNLLEAFSLGDESATEDAEKPRRLSSSALRKSWFIWQSWGQICYNYERMMGLGFCHCMVPVLKELYPNNPEAQAAGMQRHLAYFNTENTWGSIIPGITAAMEEERANGAAIDNDMEDSLKTALMGPIAGIGDSVTQSLVKVVLLSIAIGLASQGSALGPILLVVLFSAYALGVGYFCYNAGYRFGKNAVTKLLAGGLVKQLTEGLGVMGLMVLGCLVATVIPITCPLSFELATGTLAIQEVLDTILPKLLPLVAFLITYHFVKKGTKPTVILLGMFVLAAIFALTGILA